MTEIVLYNPRSSAGRTPVLPMSLLALGALLEPRWSYRIVDGNLEPEPLARLDALVAARPRDTVLGVTVMPGPQLAEAVPVCRALKQRHPELRIVWGGYFPTQHWEICLRAPYVDYVVRAHGEQVFVQLLEQLESRSGALADIPGLAYKDENGPRTNALAPLPLPAQLPSWNLARVPFERYLRATFLGQRTVGYHSSYGCPFLCNFCAVVNLVNGRWVAQPAQRVATALREYREQYGVDAVEFVDNNFFVSEARVAELAERVRPLGLAWWGEGRIDTLSKFSDTTWRAMRAAGLRMVFLGAESGSAETLARMQKGGTQSPEQTLDLVARMRAHGVLPELSFVLGNPPDPAADVAQNVTFIRRVKRVHPEAEIVLYLYTPVPLEGDLYEQARASGFAFPDSLEGWISPAWQDFAQRRSAGLPWVGRSLAQRVRDFERVLDAYHPTVTQPSLRRGGRLALRAAAAWRWHARAYAWSYELAALQRLLRYRKPQVAGF